MEEEGAKKTPLVLDWEKLLPEDDVPPAVLIVKPTTTTAQPSKQSAMDSAQRLNSQRDDRFDLLSDHELNELFRRKRRTLETVGWKLPDRGEKVRNALMRLEDEMERRKLRRVEKEADGCEKPIQSTSLSTTGVSDDFIEVTTSSQAHSQSAFASRFCRKMEESTYCGTTDAFDKELSVLNHCDSRKMTNKGKLSQRERRKGRSSRQWSSQCPSNISKHVFSNSDKKGRASSTYSLRQIGENLSSCFTDKKDAFQVVHPNRSRPKKTIVLIDEDESQILEMTEQEDKLAESMKGAKITYPSRDDPESIEICYADVDCLAPEGFLTSTIMNFYIRYIQQQASPTNRAICDYHVFNTYFYKKLTEAVSYKGNDKENFFVKFRRWWKGVNIFQKAYVLIPIHEDLHWSLVIICIPNKEDESGPIILHLDSLRLHSSQSIFQNIKCFLKEEWNYLGQEVTPSDLPIADHIWKQLPRRINENAIAVPQQKNDSDCGLFVLFFMERFIEGAPERLKKKDLAMFGKQWFKPEEASGLRAKIRKILVNEFHKPCVVDHISESFPLSTSEGNDSD
ncbi:ubiquitin-like-specific protease 1D isoform X2 [Corylus avellana]|uniref:ubiquitin-like-specific protease 1D isoform X2 n=1 Tax=Corylus avellana TaxID=13451 RepID=UPI00286A5A2F|nr:ubiquitin-like-specific protease 1D isoform X2 [Corylus avellana]